MIWVLIKLCFFLINNKKKKEIDYALKPYFYLLTQIYVCENNCFMHIANYLYLIVIERSQYNNTLKCISFTLEYLFIG